MQVSSAVPFSLSVRTADGPDRFDGAEADICVMTRPSIPSTTLSDIRTTYIQSAYAPVSIIRHELTETQCVGQFACDQMNAFCPTSISLMHPCAHRDYESML